MRQVKVFILDDDNDAVNRIELLLRDNKSVKLVGKETDPGQAVHHIRSNRPDLILLDIEMPGMGGFDLLEQIRANDYSPSVIFITAHDKYAIKAIKESAVDYLLKPVDKEELNLAVNRYIEKVERPDKETEILLLKLSPREREIFRFLQAGQTSAQIAGLLNISKNTVDTHRRKILAKLGFDSTTQIHLNYPVSK